MSTYVPNMWKIIDTKVDSWLNISTSRQYTMQPLLKILAFEVVYGCMIDYEILEDKKMLDEIFKHYEVWMDGIASLPIKIPFGGLWKGEKANEKLRTHVMELIKNRKKSSIPTVIDSLMDIREESEKEGGFVFTDFNMAQNLIVFLVAGHETIVSGFLSMMKLLAENRESFEKLCHEVWNKKKRN